MCDFPPPPFFLASPFAAPVNWLVCVAFMVILATGDALHFRRLRGVPSRRRRIVLWSACALLNLSLATGFVLFTLVALPSSDALHTWDQAQSQRLVNAGCDLTSLHLAGDRQFAHLLSLEGWGIALLFVGLLSLGVYLALRPASSGRRRLYAPPA
jgi:hypothetical protein